MPFSVQFFPLQFLLYLFLTHGIKKSYIHLYLVMCYQYKLGNSWHMLCSHSDLLNQRQRGDVDEAVWTK